MEHVTPINKRKGRHQFLAIALGLIVPLFWSGIALAKPRTDTVYKQCACLCQAPGDVIGVITDISNTGGYSCGAYNGKTCNYYDPNTGGVRTGSTKYCGGFKPGGTVNFKAALSDRSGLIMRRGVESEQPAEPEMEINIPSEDTESGEIQDRAVPRMALPGRSLSFTGCGCKGGSGTCTVTTNPVPGGDSQTCYKGAADSCTGSCDFSWVSKGGTKAIQ